MENHKKPNRQPEKLQNYKELMAQIAEDKGVAKEFQAAATLTLAKKILWGSKSKKINCSQCSHRECICGVKKGK